MKSKKIKLLKLLLTSSVAISCAMLPVSCSLLSNDNDKKITIKDYEFNNLSSEYTIESKKLNLSFVNDGNVPYVNLLQMINSLDGFFDRNYINFSTNILFSELKMTTKFGYISFNWKTNKITMPNTYYEYITKSPGKTNFNKYLKSKSYYSKDFNKNTIVIDLKKYNFDILYHNGNVLLPLAIFNLLFCSTNYYNLYFNGNKIYGCDFDIKSNVQEIPQIRNSKFQNSLIPKDIVEAKFNFTALLIDYFYGLKEYNNINSFYSTISNEQKQRMLSQNPVISTKEYIKYLYNLNDLHTWVSMPSFYNHKDSSIAKDFYEYTTNKRERIYQSTRNYLKNNKLNNWVIQTSKENRELFEKYGVRFISNNTAVISFNSFKTFQNLNDNSTNKRFSEDTYLGFANAMKLIKKNLRNMKIKNIIVDLSTNSGGNIGAMQRGLGFITDEPILNKTYNRLDEEINIRSVEVDTDGDGDYKNDAYSEYNWYLLTGVNTFSAANTFSSIFKEMKLGKIIGQKTGGGAASILPVVLPDGTSIVISSNNLSVTMKNNTIKSIEGGIEPDIYLEYKDFYNDQKLLEIIKNK
ncbi:S41 family peptidase [Metamycoplasma hominis]|uniref:S41 family peptidase n=1 Tax=Metamycoplasma hominis TaxID=2098 RepID=UPI000DEDEEFC|nr:S41 family peptidase [Metamycoplasma hominis]RCJ02509.1 hypothetical protein DSL63_01175 [Metamycoplasma hominis]